MLRVPTGFVSGGWWGARSVPTISSLVHCVLVVIRVRSPSAGVRRLSRDIQGGSLKHLMAKPRTTTNKRRSGRNPPLREKVNVLSAFCGSIARSHLGLAIPQQSFCAWMDCNGISFGGTENIFTDIYLPDCEKGIGIVGKREGSVLSI